MNFYKTLFIALSLLLAPPTYATSFSNACSVSLGKLARYLTAPIIRSRTMAEVRKRMHEILGDIYPEGDSVKVVNHTCGVRSLNWRRSYLDFEVEPAVQFI